MNYIILNSEGVQTNWKDWSDFRNAFGSKSYVPKKPPSKALINSAIKEFEEFCKTYHIDKTKYRFIQPVEFEGDWRQFDFKDSIMDKYPAEICMHSIIARKNGEIVQRVINI